MTRCTNFKQRRKGKFLSLFYALCHVCRRDSEKLKLAASKRRHMDAADERSASSGTSQHEMKCSGGAASEIPIATQHQQAVYGYYENNWYSAAMQQHQYYRPPDIIAQVLNYSCFFL